jgi:dTDP-4-amino-4,6-dideoxygalactose transaminase
MVKPVPAVGAQVAVPPLNLVANFADVREEILSELAEVAASGQYVLGPKVLAFERALAEYCGTRHAVGVSSGTDALLVALMALGIGPGDEVVVPAFTFFATAGVVARLGARPVFCDIDSRTYSIDVADMAARLTPRTEAIIPVHLYGQLADMPALLDIARQRNIPVIEDAAQAIGATAADGTRAGAVGTCGALSFYPTKNLGALGDAGAVLTNDDQLAELLVKLRIHGSGHTYHHERVGGNFRIDPIQAAVLTVKLKRLERWTEERRSRAARYGQLLTAAGLVPEHVELPQELTGRHVYHQYVLRVRRRDELAAYLRERRIGCGVYYPLPLHLQTCFADLGYKAGDLPQSEAAAAAVLALPIYPELTEQQQSAVAEAIADFYR